MLKMNMRIENFDVSRSCFTRSESLTEDSEQGQQV